MNRKQRMYLATITLLIGIGSILGAYYYTTTKRSKLSSTDRTKTTYFLGDTIHTEEDSTLTLSQHYFFFHGGKDNHIVIGHWFDWDGGMSNIYIYSTVGMEFKLRSRTYKLMAVGPNYESITLEDITP